jgi:hypothetical protein
MSSEGSRARDKTVIAKGAIETDYATYCNIMPDQTVSEPLIPHKNPLKQLDWRLEFHKGAIYRPPENPGVYGMSIGIRYGCLVKGSIFAKEKVSLQSGLCLRPGAKENEFTPGRIDGNIISLDKLEIKEPSEREKKQYGDWTAPNPQEGDGYPLVIKGNVICDVATINAGVCIEGNLIASNDVIIKPGEKDHHFVKVNGAVYSINGKVELDRCFCKTVRSCKDITVDNLVALEIPIMMATEGQITLNKDVCVVDSLLCQSCMESSDFDLRACESFLKEECPKLERLTQSDVMPYQNGSILARTWRTFKDTKRYQVVIIEQ